MESFSTTTASIRSEMNNLLQELDAGLPEHNMNYQLVTAVIGLCNALDAERAAMRSRLDAMEEAIKKR